MFLLIIELHPQKNRVILNSKWNILRNTQKKEGLAIKLY